MRRRALRVIADFHNILFCLVAAKDPCSMLKLIQLPDSAKYFTNILVHKLLNTKCSQYLQLRYNN